MCMCVGPSLPFCDVHLSFVMGCSENFSFQLVEERPSGWEGVHLHFARSSLGKNGWLVWIPEGNIQPAHLVCPGRINFL